MACNTGVSLIPKVEGQNYDFRVWGLHNGVALVEDMQTRSRWDHITGECIHGRHRGYELEAGPLLQYFKAGQAARRYPSARLALSNPPLRARLLHRTLIRRMLSPEGYLPGFFFKSSLTVEDERRLRMERGLGVVYKGEAQRFYPVSAIEQAGAIVDTIAGRRLLVYIDRDSQVPVAGQTDASSAEWQGDELVLDTGDRVRDRQRVGQNGMIFEFEQPLQLFTRWYGFALTFPNCDIYGG